MDLRQIEAAARQSLLRAIAFALLTIGCLMVGLSWNAVLAFETGAATTLFLSAVLYVRSLEAPKRDYRKTETWLLLDQKSSWPPARLQQVIGGVLRDLYWRYARVAALGALLQWVTSVILRLF